MDYNHADQQLQGRNKDRRKVDHNTYLERHADHIALKLHNTDIMQFYPNGDISLNTGGWTTVTTKDRLNHHLPNGYRIWSERGVWKLGRGPSEQMETYEYQDGITINGDKVTGASPDTSKAKAKLKRQLNTFAKDYMDAFVNGKVPAPSMGDCLYCNANLQTSDGKTLGETTKDVSHLLSHIEEKYYVPSLLQRAFESFPKSQVMQYTIAKVWGNGTHNHVGLMDSFDMIGVEQLGKSLRRYLYRLGGMAS